MTFFDQITDLSPWNRTGASRVVVFNHRARRGPSDWNKAGLDNRLNAGPLFKVHVDQSYDGAELQLRNILPEEADDLLKGRYQIINVSICVSSSQEATRLTGCL